MLLWQSGFQETKAKSLLRILFSSTTQPRSLVVPVIRQECSCIDLEFSVRRMIIKLSRHARRRARLYKIEEKIIEDVVRGHGLVPGKNEIVANVHGLSYPLKIIAVVEAEIVTVVTNYPLKKGREK